MSLSRDMTQRWRWLGLIGLSLNGLAQSLALLYFVLQLRNQIVHPSVSLQQQLPLLCALIILLALSRLIERTGAERLALNYIHTTRVRIYRHFLAFPPDTAQRMGRGGLLLRLTGDLTALRNWIVLGLIPLLMLSIWFGVALIALLLLDPTLMAALLGLALLTLPLYWWGGRYLYQTSTATRRQRARLIGYSNDRIHAVNLIQTMNQSTREVRRFDSLSRRLLTAQRRRANGTGALRALTELITLLAIGGMALVGHTRIQQGALTTDQFIIMLIVALYLLPQLRRLSRIYEYWTHFRLAHNKIQRFLDKPAQPTTGRGLKLPTGAGVEVELENSVQALRLHASARARVVSTLGPETSQLWQQLVGLVPPGEWNCALHGIPLMALSAVERSRRIVLVSDQLPLWSDTLRSNLIYGRRRSDASELQQVLELCNLDPLIARLEQGLDTRIGPRGIPLSVTETFRVLLARALLRKPSLLLIQHPAVNHASTASQLLKAVAEHFPGTLMLALDSPATSIPWADTFWCLGSVSTDPHSHSLEPQNETTSAP